MDLNLFKFPLYTGTAYVSAECISCTLYGSKKKHTNIYQSDV